VERGLCARPQAPQDHTHASGLIDQGVDLARVQYRLGHGDLQATTRYVKILDEEDPTAADVMSAILGDVA
jgi:integrase